MMIRTGVSGLGDITIQYSDFNGKLLNSPAVLDYLAQTLYGGDRLKVINQLFGGSYTTQPKDGQTVPISLLPNWTGANLPPEPVTISSADIATATANQPTAAQINQQIWEQECAAAVGTPSENLGYCQGGKYIGSPSNDPNMGAQNWSLVPHPTGASSPTLISSVSGSGSGAGSGASGSGNPAVPAQPQNNGPTTGVAPSSNALFPSSLDSSLASGASGLLSTVEQPVFGGIPLWAVLAGGVALFFMFGGRR